MSNGLSTMTQIPASSKPVFKREAFEKDIIALFTKAEGGHTSRWTYTGRNRPGHQPSGAELWSAFVAANKNYYIPSQEAHLIKEALPFLQEVFRHADTLVDLGSGDGYAVSNKAMPIVKNCPNIKTYVPVDLSEDLLTQAQTLVHQLDPDLNVVPINGDFYTDRMADSTRRRIILPGESRAGMMLGATITNMNMTLEDHFPENGIVDKIRAVGALLQKDSSGPTSLIVTYDSNPDLDGSALQAYNDIHWKRMIVGLMIDVETILQPKGDFDAFAWHHEAIPNIRDSVIHQCAVADKKQRFHIDDEPFTINRGDKFVIVNNFKYRPAVMKNLIEKAGYEPGLPLRIANNHMIIQPMSIG